ncbi:hypothetical protein [Arthronema virus TR020]|uniref:Uncharacterized protein n=1 Tax=Arthronema virus TR020 TaxID=2736280 RepID=A0A7G3WH12_9CAUD|nr:hypothetical protein [Arthronema virus TR020]
MQTKILLSTGEVFLLPEIVYASALNALKHHTCFWFESKGEKYAFNPAHIVYIGLVNG